MGCTKAQVVLLLETVLEECSEASKEECMRIIKHYLTLVKRGAWKEIMAELRA